VRALLLLPLPVPALRLPATEGRGCREGAEAVARLTLGSSCPAAVGVSASATQMSAQWQHAVCVSGQKWAQCAGSSVIVGATRAQPSPHLPGRLPKSLPSRCRLLLLQTGSRGCEAQQQQQRSIAASAARRPPCLSRPTWQHCCVTSAADCCSRCLTAAGACRWRQHMPASRAGLGPAGTPVLP
jgi:hypothetical protein